MMACVSHFFSVREFTNDRPIGRDQEPAKSKRRTSACRESELCQLELGEKDFFGQLFAELTALIVVHIRRNGLAHVWSLIPGKRRQDAIQEDERDSSLSENILQSNPVERIVRTCKSITPRNENVRHGIVGGDLLDEGVQRRPRQQVTFDDVVEIQVTIDRSLRKPHAFDGFRSSTECQSEFFGSDLGAANILRRRHFVFAAAVTQIEHHATLSRSLLFHWMPLPKMSCHFKRTDEAPPEKQVPRRRRATPLRRPLQRSPFRRGPWSLVTTTASNQTRFESRPLKGH